MADENVKPKEEPADEVDTDSGESAGNGGAAPAPDYGMLMEMLKEVQANQADLKAQLKKVTDAQSVMVDAGAVVREVSASDIAETAAIETDGFISLDDMDLSI